MKRIIFFALFIPFFTLAQEIGDGSGSYKGSGKDNSRDYIKGNINGKIVDSEYSMENGNPVYEFDIYMEKKGYEYEVEVDAVTGEILEVEKELYDIGSDS